MGNFDEQLCGTWVSVINGADVATDTARGPAARVIAGGTGDGGRGSFHSLRLRADVGTAVGQQVPASSPDLHQRVLNWGTELTDGEFGVCSGRVHLNVQPAACIQYVLPIAVAGSSAVRFGSEPGTRRTNDDVERGVSWPGTLGFAGLAG